MKRKIFSKLLMVALVIAAVGSFVSCKDYDDDINNLQKQIDAKAAISELTALQSTLEGKISTATAAAQKAAEDAAAKADASLKSTLEAAIADAKKAGTDAGTEAGKAIAAANAAQTTADAAAAAAKKADEDAKKALEDALKDIEAKYITKTAADEAIAAALKTVAENYATKAEAEEIKAEVEGLKDELEAAIDEKIDAKIQEVNNAVASVDAIWSAVTNISLFGTVTGNNLNGDFPALNFLHGQILKNSLFGNNEDNAGEQGKPFRSFSDKDSVRVENAIVVKVEPANATVDAAKLKLIDSEGNDLSDYVEFGTPEAYSVLITRGANGLWYIPVKLKDTVKEADFMDVVKVNYNAKKDIWDADILYALALNTGGADDRYVSSSFDIEAAAGKYAPAIWFDFNVNTKDVNGIHNRWDGTVVKGEEAASSVLNPEQVWNTGLTAAQKATGLEIPDTAIVEISNVSNAKKATANDKRSAFAPYEVKKDVAFTINSVIGNTGLDATGFATPVQWFYVVLDKKNAIESIPSELNAWESYSYEGLNQTVSANKPLSIRISDGTKNPSHDIIGFRVYAVNYDGTLADPDGRAFYVQVDGAQDVTPATVSSEVAYTATSATVPTANASGAKTYYALTLPEGGFETLAIAGGKGEFTLNADDYEDVLANNVTVEYQLYKKSGTTYSAVSDWKDAQYIRIISVNDPGAWLDAADAIEYTIEGTKGTGTVVNAITLKIKKEMPDGDDTGVAIKAGADFRDGTDLYVYMTPNTAYVPATRIDEYANPTAGTVIAAPGTQAAFGSTKLAEVLTIPDTHTITIASAWFDTNDDDEIVAADKTIAPAGNADLFCAVPAADVRIKADNKAYEKARWTGVVDGAAHVLKVIRTYPNISYRKLTATAAAPTDDQDYVATAKQINIHFCDPLMYSTGEVVKYQYVSSLTGPDATGNYTAQWSTDNTYGFRYSKWVAAGPKYGINPLNGNVDAPATYKVLQNNANITPVAAWTTAGKYTDEVGLAYYANGYVGVPGTTAAAFAPAATEVGKDDDGHTNSITIYPTIEDWVYMKNSVITAENHFLNFAEYVDKLTIQPKNEKAFEDRGTGHGQAFTEGNLSTIQRYSAVLTGDAADYFFAWKGLDGSFRMTQYKTAPATIAKDITGTITLKAVTPFGNSVTVAAIPFTVKKNL